jgi:CheY-like chemotaxis protein
MKKILIIDDDKDFCYVIKRRLSDLGGYKVLIAKGNNMGRWIARCRWHKPDLILLDIMIPQVDGFEILKRLKQDSITSAIPVIILSAKTEPESKKRARALGCEDYILKPVEAEVLQARIEKVLAKYH